MSDMQQRFHALGVRTGERWPGSELVTTRGEHGGAKRRMYVEHQGAVVADSGWCDGSEAALAALEVALDQPEAPQPPQPAGERRPRRRRS